MRTASEKADRAGDDQARVLTEAVAGRQGRPKAPARRMPSRRPPTRSAPRAGVLAVSASSASGPSNAKPSEIEAERIVWLPRRWPWRRETSRRSPCPSRRPASLARGKENAMVGVISVTTASGRRPRQSRRRAPTMRTRSPRFSRPAALASSSATVDRCGTGIAVAVDVHEDPVHRGGRTRLAGRLDDPQIGPDGE